MRKILLTILAVLSTIGIAQARICDFNGDFRKKGRKGFPEKWIKMGDRKNKPEFLKEDDTGDFYCKFSLPENSKKKYSFIYAGCSLADIKSGEAVKITFMAKGKGRINVCIYGYGGKYKSDRQESNDSRFTVDSDKWEEETVEIKTRRGIKKFTPAFILFGSKNGSSVSIKNIRIEVNADD